MTTPLPPRSSSQFPPFSEWYQAVNGRDPFPWQKRLAARVERSSGRWPAQINIPTGLGKTACVDIAVWALARQTATRTDSQPRTAATRIWWVVNRRLLVDDTHQHCAHIAQLLANPDSDTAVQVVARTLGSMNPDDDGSPLQALRLRGGDAHNRPRHPGQPAVICSTIPMYGSRLLFRGYGSSRSMRPIDAALAGTDSLVLVDEAHLATHLRTLITDAASLAGGQEELFPTLTRAVPQVVALTATGNPGSDVFGLDAADHAHPEVAARLAAAKPLEIVEASDAAPKALAAAAQRLLAVSRSDTASRALLVFANTPATAQATAKAMRRNTGADVLLATGRIRGVESHTTRDEIVRRVGCGRTSDGDRDVVVVATQTLEVGADLDADYLVTESCGTRALTQRLGRLNRLGQRPHARAVYVHTKPGKNDRWAVYGQEPATVLERLHSATDPDTATVDMSPQHAAKNLGTPGDDPGAAPVLAQGLLEEWAKTSAPPPGEAPPEPYFSGISELDTDVDVVWRVNVPEPGQRVWPRVHDDEIVAVGISEAAEHLADAVCVKLADDQTTTETRNEDPEHTEPGVAAETRRHAHRRSPNRQTQRRRRLGPQSAGTGP